MKKVAEWFYVNEKGEQLLRVDKFMAGEDKVLLPYMYEDGEFNKKSFLHSNYIRPLYGLDLLFNNPDKTVLIVEGEKTCDYARKLLPEFICVTWFGGTNNVASVNWTPLKDRDLILWPDNDKPGMRAMDYIASKLGHGRIVNLCGLHLPLKWDLADLDDGIIDSDIVRMCIKEAQPYYPFIDVMTYPKLSNSKNNPKPLDSTANFKHMVNHFNISIRWNMMTHCEDVIVPGVEFFYEEKANAALTYLTNLCVENELPIRRVSNHFESISWENRYHPIRDWILSKELANPEILNDFLKILKSTNDELSRALLKRWMISAIAAAFTETGFTAQGVIVLQGRQKLHKTSFLMSLVPEEMRALKSGMSIDPSNKDDIINSSEFWIAELGEIDATFKKADIAKLRSFITSDSDVVRRAYAKKNSKIIRRTVFAATVNSDNFLVDQEGNRRWWTISITEPIDTRHGLDMQQVWRAVYELYKAGESPFLSDSEFDALNESNKDFEQIDPIEDNLDTCFNWDLGPTRYLTCTQILMEMGKDNPSKSDCNRVASLLKKMKIKKGIGRQERCYFIPPRM